MPALHRSTLLKFIVSVLARHGLFLRGVIASWKLRGSFLRDNIVSILALHGSFFRGVFASLWRLRGSFLRSVIASSLRLRGSFLMSIIASLLRLRGSFLRKFFKRFLGLADITIVAVRRGSCPTRVSGFAYPELGSGITNIVGCRGSCVVRERSGFSRAFTPGWLGRGIAFVVR